MILNVRMAWRNLWRQKRRTWLTATAMIFSNVLLVFMISLQFGSYQMMIDNTLRSFSGHIQVQHEGYQENPSLRRSISGIADLANRIQEQLPDAGVAARASGFALASSDQRSLGIEVFGVQPSREPSVSTFPGMISSGRYLEEENASEMVVGSALARNLKVGIGDEITLMGSGWDGSFAAGIVTVVGIFDSGSEETNRSLAEVPLAYFQEMFSMGDRGNAVVVALKSLDDSNHALQTLGPLVDDMEELTVLDWDRLHPGLKQAIQADFSSAWLMYGVLIILVAFSVMNTQLMSVLERTREFGVMSALGIKPFRLAALILLETALMALIGLLVGLFLGWLVTIYFNQVGFSYPGMEEIAEKFNMSDRMYPSVTFLSMLLGPCVVFIFCLLAAIYPSLRLFRLQPVEAMRAV